MNTVLLCLALTVFQEARGEPVQGQRAVATVVLNRARIRDVSVCDAVLEKGQFSWGPGKYMTKTRIDGKVVYRIVQAKLPVHAKGWQASLDAARYVLEHEDTLQDIEFFHATNVHPRWGSRCAYRFRIGNHLFYARNTSTARHKTANLPLSVGSFG